MILIVEESIESNKSPGRNRGVSEFQAHGWPGKLTCPPSNKETVIQLQFADDSDFFYNFCRVKSLQHAQAEYESGLDGTKDRTRSYSGFFCQSEITHTLFSIQCKFLHKVVVCTVVTPLCRMPGRNHQHLWIYSFIYSHSYLHHDVGEDKGHKGKNVKFSPCLSNAALCIWPNHGTKK